MLDLEPRGPLPTEIYWRRRGLALGVAVVVIGIAVATIIAFVGSSAGAKPANAEKAGSAEGQAGGHPHRRRRPPAGQEVNTRRHRKPGEPTESPTPTAAVKPPPVLKEGDDCPDSTLGVKGLTSSPQYFIGISRNSPWSSPTSGWCPASATLEPQCWRPTCTRWTTSGCGPTWTARRPTRPWSKTFTPGEQVTTAVTWTGNGIGAALPAAAAGNGPGHLQPRRAAGQSPVAGRFCSC